jgi:hypothetical protein
VVRVSLEIWPDSEVFLHAEKDDKWLLYPKTSMLNNTNQYPLSKARWENCKLKLGGNR